MNVSMHRQTNAFTIQQKKQKKPTSICRVLRPPSRTCHFRVFPDDTGWQKNSSRIDFIIAKPMRRTALGPKQIKTSIVLTRRSEVWTSFPTLSMYLCTYFEVEQSFSHQVWKWGVTWRERYIKVEFAIARFTTSRKMMSRWTAKPGTRTMSLWTFPSLGITLSSCLSRWRPDKQS